MTPILHTMGKRMTPDDRRAYWRAIQARSRDKRVAAGLPRSVGPGGHTQSGGQATDTERKRRLRALKKALLLPSD